MIQVGHLHLSTDRPMGDAQARALGDSVVGEMNAALHASHADAPRLHIAELSLHLPHAALTDHALLTRCARSAVQRVLDHWPR